ncbi:RND family efflux transporter MFP subunit [Arcticibacter tournemirensis]|uniref:Efflux RND transporter periplasmic adaptor subunit n=1 Tax=Arcticibacter tournemirensis TaxID=699437 RepID=A0A5M9H3N8_9SPHI|nr:efflux RND transporter periplasmic adaptor subunit [Arcticibacter tournemirensis]KAA8481536.1 efflux RND transporter periplasmic adaptor subunit [Arcticibacter tournemirensis]TQM49078.1 RND family efflux transporter MFP subunit [Arcticibacter tournemirensis]
MKKTLFIHSIGLFCSLLLFSCGNNKQSDEAVQEDIIPVRLQPLELGSDGTIVHASGLFTTDDETVLSFKTGGVINRIFVKEGDAVKAGQVLATLNLTEVNAGAQQATLAKEKAQRDYQRAFRLYKDSVATLEQMQNARTALEVATQQLKAVSFNKQYSEIRATVSGFVLQKFANEGQMVGPGTPVLQVNGAGKGQWLLKVGVSDRQWAAIARGDKATVQTDALPGKVLQAYVFKKSEGIDPSSGTFIIHLKLNAKAEGLASGLFGKAAITPSVKIVNTWAIPYDALLDGDGGKGYVFTSDDRKTAKKTEVKIGEIHQDSVTITGGLENAKFLIVSGSPYLNDGSKIKVQ